MITKMPEVQLSPVSRMFEGRSVFITGASGFIGRVLLEKLLSSYPGIKRVYILLRAKKSLSPQERLHRQLLKVPIFDQIRSRYNADQLLAKIHVLAGDIGEPWLGLSQSDLTTLFDDKSLSIVFHSAATIKFDEPLKVSIKFNLVATRTIVDICRRLPNLISLCHVSTAYANSDIDGSQWIEEKLYPMQDEPDKLISLSELMDEGPMQSVKNHFIRQRPNTYTYTKSLAEHLIAKEASDLPVVIVRPSIVVASWRDPLPGWIDNLNGPTGLLLAIGKGLLRTMHVNRDCKADIIPVDIVVNTMIAATYYTAKTNDKICEIVASETPASNRSNGDSNITTNEASDKQQQQQQQLSKPVIVHCNSGDLNPITWGDLEDQVFPIIRQFPSRQVLRYPFGTFKRYKYHDLLTRIFVHFIPALIIDMICGLFGKKRQLFSIYQKLHSAIFALAHFCNHNYNFKSRNMKIIQAELSDSDRKSLNMSIEQMDWLEFWRGYVLGARRYILKEEDETLPESRISLNKAYYVEITLRSILVSVFAAICLPTILHISRSLI